MCRGIIFDRLSDSQRIGKLIGIGQDSFYGFRAQIMFSQFTEEICQIFLWIQMIQLSRDQNREIICTDCRASLCIRKQEALSRIGSSAASNKLQTY